MPRDGVQALRLMAAKYLFARPDSLDGDTAAEAEGLCKPACLQDPTTWAHGGALEVGDVLLPVSASTCVRVRVCAVRGF